MITLLSTPQKLPHGHQIFCRELRLQTPHTKTLTMIRVAFGKLATCRQEIIMPLEHIQLPVLQGVS
jgi:hypothetical protein